MHTPSCRASCLWCAISFCLTLLFASPDSLYGSDPTNHIVLSTRVGLGLVDEMRSLVHKESTTTYRREQKSVIHRQILDDIFDALAQGSLRQGVPPIAFVARDLVNKADRRSGTMSIYGHTASFANLGGLKTSIKMRLRMYVSFSSDHKSVKRVQPTEDRVYLEIKIKNPHYTEPQGVNKFRVIIPDHTALALLRADPGADGFDATLDGLQRDALAIQDKEAQKENEPAKIAAMINLIKGISAAHRLSGSVNVGFSFTTPRLVTSYARTAYKYVERNYPIPTVVKASKWKFWKQGALSKLGSYRDKIEYQLTVDDYVQGFTPNSDLFSPETKSINLESYFDPAYSGSMVAYPDDSITVEIKEPGRVAKLRKTLRSSTHQFLDVHIVEKLKKCVLSGFIFNHGKAGTLSHLLRTELVHQGILDGLDVVK